MARMMLNGRGEALSFLGEIWLKTSKAEKYIHQL
ncbi:uncharacterized protein METZ01_LOCUS484241, partial [marine metagenome]